MGRSTRLLACLKLLPLAIPTRLPFSRKEQFCSSQPNLIFNSLFHKLSSVLVFIVNMAKNQVNKRYFGPTGTRESDSTTIRLLCGFKR